ncbi:MAG: M23 family metallopeptidase [Bacteroidales bacterium]|nr:M23 family metallopeptidase [Bacteroidales bacterium]
MAKLTKYHFDPLHLRFYKVSPSVRQIFLRIVYFLSAGLVFSTIVVIIAFTLIDSPKERILKREIEQYKVQYEILNEKLDKMTKVLADMQDRDDNIYRVIFESEPIPSTIRKGGYGGADRYAKLEGFNNSELLIGTMKKLDRISREIYIQSKSYDELISLAKNKTEILTAIPAILPVSKKKGIVASGFGYRIHPIYKVLRMHSGIDITARMGTPVYATGDGTIQKNEFSGLGIACVINHGYGYKTVYGHLSKLAVRPGQKIKRGQVIGYIGNTGISVGPHLHYEVIKNGKYVNPVNYFFNDLSPEEYQEVIEQSSKVNQSLS